MQFTIQKKIKMSHYRHMRVGTVAKGYTELGYAENKSFVRSLEWVYEMTALIA